MRLHPDVELLLEIQDLLDYSKAAADDDARWPAADRNADALAARIAERESKLTARTRSDYERIAARLDQIIVPIVDGVCRGCNTRVPTGASTAVEVGSCQSCGRFVYAADV